MALRATCEGASYSSNQYTVNGGLVEQTGKLSCNLVRHISSKTGLFYGSYTEGAVVASMEDQRTHTITGPTTPRKYQASRFYKTVLLDQRMSFNVALSSRTMILGRIPRAYDDC